MHRIVGDTLIVTWPLASGDANARAFRAVFECRAALEAAAPHFDRRYGECAGFRASLHCGPLVAAEIGGLKGEVALVGDAMNTASRIEQVSSDDGSSRDRIARASHACRAAFRPHGHEHWHAAAAGQGRACRALRAGEQRGERRTRIAFSSMRLTEDTPDRRLSGVLCEDVGPSIRTGVPDMANVTPDNPSSGSRSR